MLRGGYRVTIGNNFLYRIQYTMEDATEQLTSTSPEVEYNEEDTAVKSINLVPVTTQGLSVPDSGSGRPKSALSDHEMDASKDCESLFRNLNNAQRFAIDIGGSLTKIAYYSTVSHRRIKSSSRGSPGPISSGADFEYEVWEGARLHFIKFETTFIEECLDFIQKNLAPNLGGDAATTGKFIKATG